MHRLAWPLRLVAVIAGGALFLTAVLVGIAPRLWAIANAHDEVPVVLPPLQPLSQRTVVFAVDGSVIAVYERENSQPIRLSQVPEPVVSALLAVEDNEYYLHHGVNLRGFMRALLSNFSSDAPRQGASTITQQVVKNEFLAGLPRDGRYKFLQAHYATMLEKQMTKSEILERYLNTVYFGNNAYGLQAAAEVYFGKSVEQLTMVEGAFLAGLVRSPSGYDPIANPEPSRRRFAQVVQRLLDVHLITAASAAQLSTMWEIPFRLRSRAVFDTKPSYYTNALRDYLLTKSTLLGATEQERANLLYRGGLRIYTTFDPAMQAQAEQARNVLPDNSKGFDAAIVALDTKTGGIRAMVGGRGLRPNVPSGEVNMALVPRQTGSSIKAFILAAGFEAGVQTNDLINGAPPCTVPDFVNGRETTKTVTSGYGVIGPFDGPNTWSSTDCGFVRLSYAIGLHRVVDSVYRLAHSVYFYQGQPAAERETFQPLPLLATGNNAMAPIDMAAGMQTIANEGVHQDPYYVDRIDRADGTRFYTHSAAGTQVLDQSVALETVQSLKGVLRSGTARRSLAGFSRPATGKTGTQYENTNAWFVGSTPQITTAVWVGDPNGYTPMVNVPEFKDLGRRTVQGADYPAMIWGNFMEAANAPYPPDDWAPQPVPPRPVARVYVPGDECVVKIVGYVTTTTDAPASTVAQAVPPGPPTATVPAPTVPTTPPVTVPPQPIYQQLPGQTTVPPDVIDPHAPVPSVDGKTLVVRCSLAQSGLGMKGTNNT